MQKWSSQLNEAIFTFRLYSLDTYFDDCTIHWENEPHATCFASLKHFTEWTSRSILTSASSPSFFSSLSTPGDKSHPRPAAATCDQGHVETQAQSTLPPAGVFLPASSSSFSCYSSLDHYDRTAFTAYTSYNHLAKIGHKADWSGGSLDWTRLGLGLKGDWTHTTLWVGTVGAYTPCHQDTYGFNAVVQLKGKKQWVLYKPSDKSYLYPCRLPYEESSIFSSVNILAPDLNEHPKFTQAHPYIVTLEPGDLLIIPAKWFHFVQCIQGDTDGICMSVNAWQSLPSDRFDQLKESLVKFLTTALIPTYERVDNTRSLVSTAGLAATTTAGTRVDSSFTSSSTSHLAVKRSSSSSRRWLNATVGDPNSREDVEDAEDAFHLVRVAAHNFTGGSRERGSQSEQGHHPLSCCEKRSSSSSSDDENPWMNLESFALQASSETLIWRLKDEKKTFLRTTQLHDSSQYEHEQGDVSQPRAQIVTKKSSSTDDKNDEIINKQSSSLLPVHSGNMSTDSLRNSPHFDLDVRTVIETILDDQVIEVITHKLLQEKGEREALTSIADPATTTTNNTNTTAAESQ